MQSTWLFCLLVCGLYDVNATDAVDILRTWHAQLQTAQEQRAFDGAVPGHS